MALKLMFPLPQINKIKNKKRKGRKEKKKKAHVISPPLLEKPLTMVMLEKEVALD